MLVLAISAKDHEFLYNANTAHKVSKKSAKKIMDILNTCKYHLKDNQTWYIHEVGYCDNAYYYAEDQKFTIYKNTVKEKRW